MRFDWTRPDVDKATGQKLTLDMVLLDVIAAGIAETKADALKYVRKRVPQESKYQSDIMKYIRQWAEKQGLRCVCWKAAQGPYSRSGVSDVLALIGRHNGDGCRCVFLAVEVKRPLFGEESALQKDFINEVNLTGGVAGVAVYREDVLPMLEEVHRRLWRVEDDEKRNSVCFCGV